MGYSCHLKSTTIEILKFSYSTKYYWRRKGLYVVTEYQIVISDNISRLNLSSQYCYSHKILFAQ